ncbi:MAG: IS110 family transposase [Candidatus Edwardsbacteria bacterium]
MLGEETFIGLDTHKEKIYGTAMNSKGEVICSYEFPSNKEALKEFLKGFPVWNTRIAIEACGIWRGCYRNLQELGYKAKLANPLKCHEIASCKKTDKIDSKILADLLRTGYLPEVYIPSDKIMQLRDLTRHKCNLTRLRVRVQNKIKGYMLREGIAYDRKIWNEQGTRWLKQLKHEKINDFLATYKLLKEQEKETSRKIASIARMKEEIALLTTIPGIGEFGAALIYAEIADIERFSSVKHLHAYAGLAPGIYQSASKSREARRRETNKWLKWIVMECASRVVLMQNSFQKYYFKLRNRKGWKTARKATARRMLTVVWCVLKNKEPYHE